MHSSTLFASILLLASNTCFAQLFVPEAVKQDASSLLEQFSLYTSYVGPTGTGTGAPAPTTTTVNGPLAAADKCAYWLDDIKHQGIAAFNPNPNSYQVFRNVKQFGAKGDGVSDDTEAINEAISSGNRCAPGTCSGSTTTPALVYFPPGTYMVNDSIVDYYFTQLIGNPNCLPTIKAFPGFHGAFGVIDGDQYQSGGALGYGATNVFWRQIRNFIIDTTAVAASNDITGIHWPTAQATSIQNVVFKMSEKTGTQHNGLFIETGSGGFLNDLVFYGGLNAAIFGNQQFSMRNLTFYNAVTAINQNWDWGWLYSGINVHNCGTGLNMSNASPSSESVGSVVLIDSKFVDTKTAVLTSYTQNSSPPAAGSLILENVSLNNVNVAVEGGNGQAALAGSQGAKTIEAWGEGHAYTPSGPHTFQGSIAPNSRPSSLTSTNSKYYARSKPQYQHAPVSEFISARNEGATGDGTTDDTAALQKAINAAAAKQKILFVDQGDYLVTKTIYVPAGSRIVGEAYPVILAGGAFFSHMGSPQPVVQLGKAGEKGSIQWSDMLVSTRGQQPGAIMIEYNLAAPSGTPSGIWDVHTRIGGFTGSDLQVSQCPTTSSSVIRSCIAGFMDLHITKSSSGLYMENNWLWTADHDVDSADQTQISIYNGRGLVDQSTAGPVWLVGTAVEHHTLYQYSFVDTKDVFAGFIQTETPYYQPNPPAPHPFTPVSSLGDPSSYGPATITANGNKIPNADAWGLRIISSENILIYGAGHYSFFNNYSTTCSDQGNGEVCQSHIVDVNPASKGISIYGLSTVGTHYMLAEGNAQNKAVYSQNLDGFVDTIALYRNS